MLLRQEHKSWFLTSWQDTSSTVPVVHFDEPFLTIFPGDRLFITLDSFGYDIFKPIYKAFHLPNLAE